MPPLLWSTSWHHRIVSHFLSMEPRRARCLRFIFQQCFVPLAPLLSRNWSIESAPPPPTTLPGPPDSHPPLLWKCHLNFGHPLHHSTVSSFCLVASQITMLSELHPSPSSHTDCPSTQWHPQWWTSQSFFASRTAYRYVNSYKYKIFWNPVALRGVIN
jgi:hypothetical protein